MLNTSDLYMIGADGFLVVENVSRRRNIHIIEADLRIRSLSLIAFLSRDRITVDMPCWKSINSVKFSQSSVNKTRADILSPSLFDPSFSASLEPKSTNN